MVGKTTILEKCLLDISYMFTFCQEFVQKIYIFLYFGFLFSVWGCSLDYNQVAKFVILLILKPPCCSSPCLFQNFSSSLLSCQGSNRYYRVPISLAACSWLWISFKGLFAVRLRRPNADPGYADFNLQKLKRINNSIFLQFWRTNLKFKNGHWLSRVFLVLQMNVVIHLALISRWWELKDLILTSWTS